MAITWLDPCYTCRDDVVIIQFIVPQFFGSHRRFVNEREKNSQISQKKIWLDPGFEPGTSRNQFNELRVNPKRESYH